MKDNSQGCNNVLYISYDGMTDPLGQSQVIPYLKGLSALGYRITILSSEKKQAYEKHNAKIQLLLSESGIDWCPVFYTKSPPILSTVYDYSLIKRKAKQICIEKKINLVHCRSYIPAMAGAWLKKELGVKFIFDMRGFWADERVDGKLWNLNNPVYRSIYRFFKKKEKQLLEDADYIVTLTKKAKAEIHSWKHIANNPVRIVTIPCCVDVKLFDPGKVNAVIPAMKAKLGINEQEIIISYLGSIGTWYMLPEMLDFFCILKARIASARFLFITPDDHDKILESALQKGIKTEDIIFKSATREEVPSLLSVSDYSIFFILPAYSKMASSPTKQGEIMAMGIPVICNAGVGDTDDIVQKFDSGILVQGSDYNNAVQKIIDKQIFDPVRLRAGADEYFSLTRGVGGYAGVYKQLI